MKSKITLQVTVDLECTDPEGMTKKEFESQDVKAMKKYLAETIKDQFLGKWQFAARVTKASVK